MSINLKKNAREIGRHLRNRKWEQTPGGILIDRGGMNALMNGAFIDALNGFPGPLIKWMLKSVKQEGIYALCRDIHNMRAHAKTVIGYAHTDGNIHYFEGDTSGTIVLPQGDGGFGWDQIFKPDGFEETFAEMGEEYKGEFSMRSIAFKQLRDFLNAHEK